MERWKSWRNRFVRKSRFQSVNRKGVRFISNLENKKNLCPSKHFVGTSVQRGQQRLQSLILNKDKLCYQQSLRKRLRLRSNMISRRTGEPVTACSTRKRKISRGISECLRNSPGRDRGEPKKSSAAENPESSLGEERRPNVLLPICW